MDEIEGGQLNARGSIGSAFNSNSRHVQIGDGIEKLAHPLKLSSVSTI